MIGRKHTCDVGMLLGDKAYYITGDTCTVTANTVRAESAIGEATSFFADEWGKREGKPALRFALETPSVAVDQKNVAMFNRRFGARRKVRELLNIAPNACFAFSPPRTTQGGIFSQVAIDEHGVLKQLRERLIDDGATVGGGWPWFAVAARIAARTYPKEPVAVVAISPLFSSVTIIEVANEAAEIAEYTATHHEELNSRGIAFSSIIERVGKLPEGTKLLLVSPEQTWAERETEIWNQLLTVNGGKVVPLSALVAAISSLNGQSPENLLYTGEDTFARILVNATKVAILAVGVFGVMQYVSGYQLRAQMQKQTAALQHQLETTATQLRTATDRKEQITKLEAGILSPTTNDATGTGWLLQMIQKDVPDNMLVTSLRVAKREWRIDTIWFPVRRITPGPGQSEQAVREMEQRVRETVGGDFMNALKEDKFPGQRLQVDETRPKAAGSISFSGHMP